MASDYKEQKLIGGSIPSDIDYEVVQHRIGNQTNAEDNHNKYFSAELWKSKKGWYVFTNYGRVNDKGACGLYGPDDQSAMESFFESKFKSKVRPSKGYVEIKFVKPSVGSPKAKEKTYGVSEDEIPEEKKKLLKEQSTATPAVKSIDLHPTVKRLVEQWYKESSNAITSNSAITITKYGLETPLGVLSFSQLDKGKTVLGNLGDAVKKKDETYIKQLSSEFYTHIPTNLGRKFSDQHLINSDAIIQQKLDLIQMMADALELGGKTYVSDIDTKYLELGTKIEFLDKTDADWKRIEHKIKSTKGSSHYNTTDKVLNVMRIELMADRPRYSSCNVDKEEELFHGSRNCNLVGIFKSGMKIAPPEAPRSGLAFGRGAYFAKNSSKSVNYSLYPFPGVNDSKNCFLFLFNIKLGNRMKVNYGAGNEADICEKKGFNSVHAEAGRGLIYDEFIIPKVEQCTATYIVELQR